MSVQPLPFCAAFSLLSLTYRIVVQWSFFTISVNWDAIMELVDSLDGWCNPNPRHMTEIFRVYENGRVLEGGLGIYCCNMQLL